MGQDVHQSCWFSFSFICFPPNYSGRSNKNCHKFFNIIYSRSYNISLVSVCFFFFIFNHRLYFYIEQEMIECGRSPFAGEFMGDG